MSKILIGVVLLSIAVIPSVYRSPRSSVQRIVAAANPAPANGRWSLPRVDPANFVSRVDNPYLPLTPGTTLRYRGVQKDGTTPQGDTFTVTHQTKVVMGVTCVVVRTRSHRGVGRSSEPTTGSLRTGKATSGTWARRRRNSCTVSSAR